MHVVQGVWYWWWLYLLGWLSGVARVGGRGWRVGAATIWIVGVWGSAVSMSCCRT